MSIQTKKRKSAKVGRYGYLFVLPFFLVFFVFYLYPILYTFYLSLTRLNQETYETFFAGVKNYEILIKDTVFYKSLLTNFILWIVAATPQISVALVLAAILNVKSLKLKGLFKAIYYLPNLVTAASIGTLFLFLFSWQTGSVNKLLQSLNIISEPINWLNNPTYTRLIVSFIQWWMWFGYSMIIFNAAMKGISDEIYQAAKVDGAKGIQVFFRITLPIIKPVILYSIITSLIGGMQIFDIPKTLTGGGPEMALNTTVLYIYGMAFVSNNHGYAAAVSFGLMFVIVIFSLLFYKVLYKREND